MDLENGGVGTNATVTQEVSYFPDRGTGLMRARQIPNLIDKLGNKFLVSPKTSAENAYLFNTSLNI